MPETTFRSAGAMRIAVRSWRGAPARRTPVVLLAGTGATAADWDVVAADLSRDRDAFAIDLRGHGASDWPGVYSIALMAQDVAAVLPSLAPEVDLIGHSLGGLVAGRVAAGRTAAVRRLVLEDVGVPHPRPPATPSRPEGELDFDWAMVEQIRLEIDTPDPAWPTILASIPIPVLAIGGGASSFVFQEHIAELVDLIPHATAVGIDAGHEIHAGRPAQFLDRVRTFLDR